MEVSYDALTACKPQGQELVTTVSKGPIMKQRSSHRRLTSEATEIRAQEILRDSAPQRSEIMQALFREETFRDYISRRHRNSHDEALYALAKDMARLEQLGDFKRIGGWPEAFVDAYKTGQAIDLNRLPSSMSL